MRQTIHKTIPNPTQTSILDQMSEETGNTIAVLRQSYIHPKVLKAFKDQKILNVAPHGPTRLRKYERLVLGILNRS